MIKGLRKVSIIDFPRRICAVVFTGGCNFRCPYCHNPELVVGWEKLLGISEDEVCSFLKKRTGFLDGLCITGGEPTLYKILPNFIRRIKKMGFSVKLDTNGTNPQMIEELIDEGLIDYIAMDVKAIPEKYNIATGVQVNFENIERSIRLIMQSGIEYELRATVFPDFLSKEDGKILGDWLRGAKRFTLQRPRKLKMLLDVFKDRPTYAESELHNIKDTLSDYIEEVMVR